MGFFFQPEKYLLNCSSLNGSLRLLILQICLSNCSVTHLLPVCASNWARRKLFNGLTAPRTFSLLPSSSLWFSNLLPWLASWGSDRAGLILLVAIWCYLTQWSIQWKLLKKALLKKYSVVFKCSVLSQAPIARIYILMGYFLLWKKTSKTQGCNSKHNILEQNLKGPWTRI